MKKILLLAFTLFSINSIFAQSQRLVLVEEFTQASCPPCETTTPALNALMNSNLDKIVQIRYQTSWPGVDPMNADNPGEVQERVDYYGVTGVPNLLLDGVDTNTPGTATQAQVDNAYNVTAPVAMTLTHTLSDDLTTANVTIEITNEGTEAYNMATNRLRVALIEEDITWTSPPGSTSLTVFEAVMKTFLTGTAGMPLPEIAAGETWTNTWEDVAIPSRIYDFNKLAVIAFIQNDADRRVAQSAHSSPVQLGAYPDLGVMNSAAVEGGLCDYAFTGSAEITNAGDLAADTYTVDMYLNGELNQSRMIEEALEPGASTSVTFDEINLPPGNSVFGYIVTGSQGDLSTVNNSSAAIQVGKAAGVAEEINRTFENDPADAFNPAPGTIVSAPFNTLNFTVVNQDLIGGNSPLGGHGESTNSISVYLWAWNPASVDANGYMIIADQYEVSANEALSFDYAYTSWQGSNDRMIVEISTDCGDSFSELFNEAGADLRTGAEINNGQTFWRPGASEWETVELDLSAYEGETVLVRFRVVSAYGDMIYLDNIEFKTLTSLNELDADESLRIFPNPAATTVNVDLTTPNASNVTLRVIDMLGRTLKTENLGSVSGKINHALDVTSLSNGAYLLLVNVDGRDVVKRLNVSH